LDASASSESGADFTSLYGAGAAIPRAKLKTSSGADSVCPLNSQLMASFNQFPCSHQKADARAAQLAGFLEEGLRIPRAHLHDGSSLESGSSEFTIREEIERRIITVRQWGIDSLNPF
jgi:hypothetical protein